MAEDDRIISAVDAAAAAVREWDRMRIHAATSPSREIEQLEKDAAFRAIQAYGRLTFLMLSPEMRDRFLTLSPETRERVWREMQSQIRRGKQEPETLAELDETLAEWNCLDAEGVPPRKRAEELVKRRNIPRSTVYDHIHKLRLQNKI